MATDDLERALADLWAEQPDPARTASARKDAVSAFRAGPVRRPRRLTRAVGVAAALASIGAAGTAAASQGALPGDSTYGAKLALERVGVLWARGDAAEAEAWLGIAERRISEAVEVTSSGDVAGLVEIVDGYREAVDQVRRHLAGLDPLAPVALRAEREFRAHDEVLAALLGLVPPEARPALELARDAVEDAAPEMPQTTSMPEAPDPTPGPTPTMRPTDSGGADQPSGTPAPSTAPTGQPSDPASKPEPAPSPPAGSTAPPPPPDADPDPPAPREPPERPDSSDSPGDTPYP